MTLGKLISYLVVLAGLVAILIYLLVRPPTFSEIQREIKIANFCGSDEDCEVIESKCPFDCNVAVRANKAENIQDLINSYETDCSDSCVKPTGVVCVNNKCQTTKR